MSKFRDRVLALGGILQACALVQQVARRGTVDTDALQRVLRTLFETDPPDAAAVYGGTAGVQDGLRLLVQQLDGKPDAGLTRYLLNVLHLERKLRRKPELLQSISRGIERAREQMEHYPLPHDNIVAALAGIYSDTVSTLTPRIIVKGEEGHLANPGNTDLVRALLLAAIRSAVLWRQCGGSRWQILLLRSRLVQAARDIIDQHDN